jgi:hypothetical protein
MSIKPSATAGPKPMVRKALVAGVAAVAAVAFAPLAHASQEYFKTPWGTRCQVTANDVICDTCEPGLLVDTPAGAANCPGAGTNQIAVNASGASESPTAGVILPVSPDIQQLAAGHTYHANGWTIVVDLWVRFTNDATGHGMAVAAQNSDRF